MNVVKLAPKTGSRKTRGKGLIGLFGHTYAEAEENPDWGPVVQRQFEIIREVKRDRYLVQYFSWIDGSPVEVGVMPESEVLGSSVKLYSTREDWVWAYEKASAYRRAREGW